MSAHKVSIRNMFQVFSVFRTPTLTEELSQAIISKQREVIQREVEQIKMNHSVMASKAILDYLSRISRQISSTSTDSTSSPTR